MVMWYLVYFPATKQHCVVDENDLDAKDPGLDAIVGVKYPDNVYPAKILRKHRKKGYLMKLHVSLEGEVSIALDSALLMENAEKASKVKNDPTSRISMKGKRKSTSHVSNMDIVDNSKPSCSGINRSNRSKIRKTRSKPIVDDDSSDSGSENNAPLKIDNVPRNKHDISENIPEVIETVEESSINDSFFNIINSFAKTCESMPISIETIRVVEHLLKLLIQINQAQTREKRESSSIVNSQSHLTYSWQLADDSKIELIPRSGVWINATNLDLFKRRAKSDANKLIRFLFKELIGEQNLPKLTAKGQSGKAKIPEQVYNTIESYIQKTFFGGEVYESFTSVVNQMICTIRADQKRDEREAKKTSSSGKSTEKEKEVLQATRIEEGSSLSAEKIDSAEPSLNSNEKVKKNSSSRENDSVAAKTSREQIEEQEVQCTTQIENGDSLDHGMKSSSDLPVNPNGMNLVEIPYTESQDDRAPQLIEKSFSNDNDDFTAPNLLNLDGLGSKGTSFAPQSNGPSQNNQTSSMDFEPPPFHPYAASIPFHPQYPYQYPVPTHPSVQPHQPPPTPPPTPGFFNNSPGTQGQYYAPSYQYDYYGNPVNNYYGNQI